MQNAVLDLSFAFALRIIEYTEKLLSKIIHSTKLNTHETK